MRARSRCAAACPLISRRSPSSIRRARPREIARGARALARARRRATTRSRRGSAKARRPTRCWPSRRRSPRTSSASAAGSRDHEVDEMLAPPRRSRRRAPVGTMSGGEKRRVALARMLVAQPDARDLRRADEPSRRRHDRRGSRSYLVDEFPGAVLLVTHDRYLLDARRRRASLELDRGAVCTRTTGGFERLTSSRRRSASRTPSASSRTGRTSSAGRSSGCGAGRRRARRSRRRASSAPRRAMAARRCASRRGRAVELDAGVVARSARRSSSSRREPRARRPHAHRRTSTSLVKGERIGIVGPNGAGKTTLLRLVIGEAQPDERRGRCVGTEHARSRTSIRRARGLDDDWTCSTTSRARCGAPAVTIGGRHDRDSRNYLELFLFEARRSGGRSARCPAASAHAWRSRWC